MELTSNMESDEEGTEISGTRTGRDKSGNNNSLHKEAEQEHK